MAKSRDASGSGLELVCKDSQTPRRPRHRNPWVVDVVKLQGAPLNKENPYARFSTMERYERVIKHLAEIWSAITKRKAEENSAALKLRKVAA